MTDTTIVVQDTLATAVTALITKTIDGVDASVAFMQAELPDYIVQLLMWHGVKSGIMYALAILYIASFLTWIYRIEGNAIDSRTPPGRDVGIVVSGILCLPFGISLFDNLTWLQIWIAPKVWLVEYAAALVK